MTNNPDKEITVFLIEKKAEMLQSIGQVTMLWWVTVIVLCLSVFGAAWLHRRDVDRRKHVWVAGAAVFAVLCFFAAYGSAVMLYLDEVGVEFQTLLRTAGVPSQTFTAEIRFFKRAMWTATGDFVVIVVAWLLLCYHIGRNIKPDLANRVSLREPASTSGSTRTDSVNPVSSS